MHRVTTPMKVRVSNANGAPEYEVPGSARISMQRLHTSANSGYIKMFSIVSFFSETHSEKPGSLATVCDADIQHDPSIGQSCKKYDILLCETTSS